MSEEGSEINVDKEVNQAAFEVELSNAADRIAEQKETFREFSQEGIKIFRLVLLFLAGPAAILGGLSPDTLANLGVELLSSNCAIGQAPDCIRIRGFAIFTGGLFVVVLGLNITAAGFESRGIHSFTNPEDIVNTIESKSSLSEYQYARLKQCVERIEHNNKILSVTEQFLAIGKVALYFASFCVATLAYVIISNSFVPSWYWVGGLLIYFAPLGVYVWYFPPSYLGADRLLNQDPLYNQERITKFIDKQKEERKKGEEGSE